MRRLILAPAVAVALLVTALAGQAGAEDPTPVESCPKGVCLAVGIPGIPGEPVGGGSASTGCRWHRFPPDEAAQLEKWSPHPGEPGGWFYNDCPGSEAWPVWIPQTPGSSPAATPATLALEARRLLPIPDPQVGTNPVASQDQLVHLPVWLWIEQATWGSRSASVSLPGKTVRAVAVAETVTWSMGDRHEVVCRGPGTPYDPRRAPAAQHTACSYTYEHSSASEPNERFTVTATVTWRVTWTGTGTAPATGQLPPLRRSAQVSLRVAEGQALN